MPVYDAGEVEGRAFISMRLVPGDTLAERIARGGALDPDEALSILSDIGEAIDFAHAQGTVHRDVKPGNILLDPAGTAFLSDFGLVRLDDMPGLTRRGDWLGTAEYVSPEQVEGEPATASSDVYGAGGGRLRGPDRPGARSCGASRAPCCWPTCATRSPTRRTSGRGLPAAVDRGARARPGQGPGRPAAARGRLVDELRDGARDARRAPSRHRSPRSASRTTASRRPARRRLAACPTPGRPPWRASGARPPPNPGGDRPTQAFGDAARRRAMALGRDVAVTAAVAGGDAPARRGRRRRLDHRELARRRLGRRGARVRAGPGDRADRPASPPASARASSRAGRRA